MSRNSASVVAGASTQITVASITESDDPAHARAFVFESFGEGQDAVLYLDRGVRDPWVVIASDHLADVPPPGERTLSGYLDGVLATWCSVWRRGEPGPRRLDDLLRRRRAVDLTRLFGARVRYIDEHRAHAVMRGRVVNLVEATRAPDWWSFARTLAEVEDDLGETLYVPLRCLFPADPDDPYERLRGDPAGLVAGLEGPPEPLFRALAPMADGRHFVGVHGGPALADTAWVYAALCSRVPADRAARVLVVAVDRLLRDEDVHRERPVAWSPDHPRRPLRPHKTFGEVAVALLDALLILSGRARPSSLSAWLGASAATRLRGTLSLLASRDPLRGYDPRRDTSKGIGALWKALEGAPVVFDTSARGTLSGERFGLADRRVVTAANFSAP